MIVRAAHGVLHLIAQPDHAALAARVMRRWAPLREAPRRASILHAIAAHDDGWREADAAPAVDPATGRPFDFLTTPPAIRQAVWRRGVARVEADAWAAALVAHHAIVLHDRHRDEGAWEMFFRDLVARRDACVEAAGRGADDLAADYRFLRLGDLLSLMFCQGQTHEEQAEGWTLRVDGASLLASPDPFAGRQVALAVPAREVADRRYESDADLREAVRTARVVALRGTARGEPRS